VSPKPIDIVIPKRLRNPHPAVAEMLSCRETARREYAEEWRAWVKRRIPKPAKASTEHRRLRVLDALLNALESRGAEVALDGRSFTYQDTKIEFELWGGEALAFSIKTDLAPGAQRSWRETVGRPIEQLLPAILGGLLAGAEFLVAKTEASLNAKLLADLQWQQKRELERRSEDDERRWRSLVDLAKQVDECESVRRLLSSFEANDHSEPSVVSLLSWAENKIQKFETSIRDPEMLLATLNGAKN
jgi:hypothetical protein